MKNNDRELSKAEQKTLLLLHMIDVTIDKQHVCKQMDLITKLLSFRKENLKQLETLKLKGYVYESDVNCLPLYFPTIDGASLSRKLITELIENM